MNANARTVKGRYSRKAAELPAARTYAPHAGSPVADLHRLLADRFDDAELAAEWEKANDDVERLTHDISRAFGIISLIGGYVLTGYLVSRLFF